MKFIKPWEAKKDCNPNVLGYGSSIFFKQEMTQFLNEFKQSSNLELTKLYLLRLK